VDATLPDDYFARIRDVPVSASAALYPFWHERETDPECAWAIEQYELFLRYYEHGLRYSGSPYAFQTLGSTIAIRALSYAQVRGFPRRAAAEDFYLLNKAAKVGSIVPLGGSPILLKGRPSHRVPFGTGRAVIELRDVRRRNADYLVYSPIVFDYLRSWIFFLNTISTNEDCVAAYDKGDFARVPSLDGRLLLRVLDVFGARGALREAKSQSSSTEALRRRLHVWFDAFQTLKLIHRLTDVVGKIPLLDAIGSAQFLPRFSDSDVSSLRRDLAKLAASSESLLEPREAMRLYLERTVAAPRAVIH
jgi:hypothetical protein